MPDKVKVFRNLVAQQPAASLAAVSLNVVTNNSTTQAVIKDLSFSIDHPTAEYKGLYKYPYTIKLDNYTLLAGSGSGTFSGSQIVDSSQTLAVEIQPESQLVDYGILQLVATVNGVYRYIRVPLNTLGSVPTTQNLLAAIDGRTINTNRTMVDLPTVFNGTSGCSIFRNGEIQFAYAYSSGQLIGIFNSAGVQLNTINVTNLGFNVNQITSDGTYIYGARSDSTQQIPRWLISTLAYSTISTTGGLPSVPTSNSGFFEHYNGFLYLRGQGWDSNVYIINTATGTSSINSTPASDGSSENVGGRITVNRAGVPFLVEHQDTRIMCWNINANTVTYLSPVWGTDPTTITAKTSLALSNGIVLFNNANYSSACVVDVNGTPTATRTDGSLPLGGSASQIMISVPFQTAPVAVPRNITYNMHANGIEIT